MANVSINQPDDWLDMYDGFNFQQVGLGLINPNIYATPKYQKKKVERLVVGGLAEIVYAGREHDLKPLVLTMGYEQAYNTIISYNLNYVPVPIRQAIIQHIIQSNQARIRNNQPIMIDYHSLKRRIPASAAIVRRYKNVGVNVVGNIPLKDWPVAIKQPSQWSNHYKQFM